MNHDHPRTSGAYCGRIRNAAQPLRSCSIEQLEQREQLALLAIGEPVIMSTILSYIVLSALGLSLMGYGYSEDMSGVFTLGAGICLLTTMFYIYVWFIEPFLMGTNTRETRPKD